MERLTTNLNGTIYYSKGKYPPTTICAEMENWEVRECITKLAEYEDTGLTPEEAKILADFKNKNKGVEEYFEVCVARDKAITERDFWERESKKYCSQLGEIRILAEEQ